MTPEPTPGPTDADVELLESVPSVGVLIARAVVTAPGRPGVAGTLPARQVMVTGVAQDPARLAAYARVCGLTLRDRVPPTWLHVLTFPLQVHLMAARDFPFAMPGMVHVANAMTLHRPVEVGEHLTLTSRADALRPHRAGATVELLGEARVGDEVVWEGASTYLVRGGRPEGEAPEQVTAGVSPSVPSWARWRLPAGLGRAYAAVSGDVNPIHLSPVAARAFGFSRTVAHGMWTHARVLAALEGRLPPALHTTVRFHKPVLLPSTVDFGGAAQEGGWRFAVTSGQGAREHLTGLLQPVAEAAS